YFHGKVSGEGQYIVIINVIIRSQDQIIIGFIPVLGTRTKNGSVVFQIHVSGFNVVGQIPKTCSQLGEQVEILGSPIEANPYTMAVRGPRIYRDGTVKAFTF